MRRTQILMNKVIYLGLSILEIGEKLMHEFWYAYVKPNNGKKKRNYVTWIQTAL